MKFVNLLKKELLELLNKQMILGMAVSLILFMIIGNVMETTINEASAQSYTVNLCDRDNTEFTQELISRLEDSGAKITNVQSEGDDYSQILNDNNLKCLIIIPEGFTDSIIKNGEPGNIISVAEMKSAAAMSNISNNNSGGISAMESVLKVMIAENDGISSGTLEIMNAPAVVAEKTVVADKSASISMSDIMNKIMMQNMILPIIVFVLIIMTSQTLISTIANEKIDKTLETLLSAPVSRTSVIGAKMLAAAIVALINAVVYMIGFSVFMSGAADSISEEASAVTSSLGDMISVEAALSQLGLSLSPVDYLLTGIQLFLTIMICLSISLILGALVNDTKSSQTVVMPLMMMAMVPYIISMLADINSLPTAAKLLVYAIPFTHTFSAMSNLMFGNTSLFFGGLAYQVVIFAICMFFAVRLFKSDKIFTISLNFAQKSKFKKNSKKNA